MHTNNKSDIFANKKNVQMYVELVLLCIMYKTCVCVFYTEASSEVWKADTPQMTNDINNKLHLSIAAGFRSICFGNQ